MATQIELKERDKKIIELRKKCTLQSIGEMFGLSRERIRQIEIRAKRRIALSKRTKDGGMITMDSDIERLDMPIMADNCLRKSDINTIRDIIEAGPFELLRIKGLGRKCFYDIRDALKRCGFRVWNI